MIPPVQFVSLVINVVIELKRSIDSLATLLLVTLARPKDFLSPLDKLNGILTKWVTIDN
jgi:hypothetical protein